MFISSWYTANCTFLQWLLHCSWEFQLRWKTLGVTYVTCVCRLINICVSHCRIITNACSKLVISGHAHHFLQKIIDCDKNCQPRTHLLQDFRILYEAFTICIMAISHCSNGQCECHCKESANHHLQLTFADNNCHILKLTQAQSFLQSSLSTTSRFATCALYAKHNKLSFYNLEFYTRARFFDTQVK